MTENNTPFPTYPLPTKDGREVLTYSALSSFRNCGRKFDLRYQHRLSGPRAEALNFGGITHDAVEAYYLAHLAGEPESVCRDKMLAVIEAKCDGHAADPDDHHRWHHILALTQAYVDRWSASSDEHGQVLDSDYELLAIEREFSAPITNPETGAESRTFVLAGKVDGVIRLREDGRLYVLERKTSSAMGGDYFAKLWADFQSMLYAHYLSKYVYHEPFGGVLYDVLGKHTRMSQKQGETEEAFEERLAKYKTAKTVAKHRNLGPKPAETDEEFHERIMARYSEPESQHRELILFDSDRLEQIEHEVWDLTKQIMAARNRGRFTMNTSNCYAFGRACNFVNVCRAGRLDEATAYGLDHSEPHSELDLDRPVGVDDSIPF